jgi:hypothetical protein
MSNRRKLSFPHQGAPPLAVEMSIERIRLDLTPAQRTLIGFLEEKARESLEDVMDDMRLQGVSEEQLAAFVYAVRKMCVTELWSVDLEGALISTIQGGPEPNLRDIVAFTLIPGLKDSL